MRPRRGVLGHPFPMFAARAPRASAAFSGCVAVGFRKFVVEPINVVGVGFVEDGLGEVGLGEQDGEASEGLRLGGHARPSIDNPQGGTNVVVAHRLLNGTDVAGELLGYRLFGAFARRWRGRGVFPKCVPLSSPREADALRNGRRDGIALLAPSATAAFYG